MDAILQRRSVRKFTQEPISEAQTEALLRAAMAAPSARNAQPWEFIVVKNPETLRRMSEASPYAGPLAGAPLGIVVCGDLSRGLCLEYHIQDCAAATENLLLEAQALSLGGVWLGMYPNEDRTGKLKALFSLPDSIVPLWAVAVGHPAEPGRPIDKFTPERIHCEGWNGTAPK